MTVGQAYSGVLTLREQQALTSACDILIDEFFEDLKSIETPDDIVGTSFEDCLPGRYLPRYTPLFLKQFTVCIITVAWKLAQPQHKLLASVAEELAAWAIIRRAQSVIEEEGLAGKKDEPEPFHSFIDVYFEDTDFEYLFDDAYDGIDEDPVVAHLGIASLSFHDWFKPFSDESSRIAHPYVS